MELHIEARGHERTVGLIVINLVVTFGLMVLAIWAGEYQQKVEFGDIFFEAASVVVAFALFVAGAQVRIKVARVTALLLGLFLFQLGRLLDVLDEVVYFDVSAWSVAGDALTLIGEVLLAMVAFQFVKVTTLIANTDRLTELYNKAFHMRRLSLYLKPASNAAGKVAVIAIDLDKFKLINDRYGHSFGDEVLKHISGLLTDVMAGQSGIVSRTGGEEFEVLLNKTDQTAALQLAEQLRLKLEENPPSGLELATEKVTASIGVALNEVGETASQFRKRADAASYLAKQTGRNKVCLADMNQTLTVSE